jgi:farnesyl diphosphate synthase
VSNNMPQLKLVNFSRLHKALADSAQALNEEINRLLPIQEGIGARLIESMRYSSLNGGKRLRPFLVMTAADIFSVSPSCAVNVAAALELLHCYSLVHDDLPSMDNSDLRRGKPSCHVEFDEATAILAGDGLLTYAFEILTHPRTHSDPAVRVELIRRLSQAAGPYGMVGGQMLDIESENKEWSIGAVTRLQRLKTGELFAFACEAGAILGKAPQPIRNALLAYAHDLGLAFQITDDLLDVEASTSDKKHARRLGDEGKPTFVSILGLEKARLQANILADQAISHLDVFDSSADLLRDLARFIVERES